GGAARGEDSTVEFLQQRPEIFGKVTSVLQRLSTDGNASLDLALHARRGHPVRRSGREIRDRADPLATPLRT
ncbi:hypothetical protein, partial [Micromonospora sicca]|uniref:hypothetical protein n=1 Tax=Micromonospora sicca TaxID=2202420 RepID=UPI001F4680F1